jgi:LEA14-like dessication related protein
MRWGIWGARAAIVAVNVVIVLIIILSVVPLANGGLKVDIPQENVGKPTFENNMVRFTVPVKIYNGGYFDITDLKMSFVISSDGVQVADYASLPANIVTGRTTTLDIALELDLNDISATALQKLVFEQSELDLRVGVEAGYRLGLVKASVHTNQTMNWDPLVSNFMVDTGGIQAQDNGTNVDLSVPYSFNANDIITGNAVSLETTVRNATSQIGSSFQTITIQSYNAGAFKLTIDKQALMEGGELIIGADLGFEGVSLYREYTYHWDGVMP